MKLKEAKFPLIMSIISLLIFVVIYLMITYYSVVPYYTRGLVFAIPFVVFSIITYMTVKGKLKRQHSNLITGILVLVIPIVMVFQLVHISVDYALNDFTEVEQYGRILRVKNHNRNDHIAHFPKEIPQNATEVEVFYTPKLLQGGELLYLKYSSDSQHINQLENQYSDAAQWSGPSSHQNTEEYYGVDNTSFDLVGYNILPEHFTLYILDSKPYNESQPQRPENWNHGYTYGLAISKQTNTVIYFYNNW